MKFPSRQQVKEIGQRIKESNEYNTDVIDQIINNIIDFQNMHGGEVVKTGASFRQKNLVKRKKF